MVMDGSFGVGLVWINALGIYHLASYCNVSKIIYRKFCIKRMTQG